MADAQPRKRKDKRRKKDDSITGENDPRSPPIVMPQKSSGDDTNIHVYHDAHTGGGWCAKIVFFILLAIIGVLIGVILLEYRGSTDLDAPVQDSKYAEIFEGWIDDTPQLHDDEDEHPIDDHDDEHDDDHDDDGHEDEGDSDEHEDEAENGSEEGEQEEADDEEQSEISNEVEEEEGANDGDNDPDEEPQADEPDEEEQEDSIEIGNDEEGEENADDDENNSEANNDDGDDDGDDLSAEDIQKVLDSLEEDDALEEIDEAAENSNENEVVDNNPEEAELLRQQEEAETENEEESSSVAVKFGVGVALLVVAHLVLVRKWNNASNAEVSSDSSVTMSPPKTVTDTSEGDLSRRNTIVSEDTVKSLHEAMERARIESQAMTDEEELEDEEEEDEEEEEIEVESYPKYSSSYRSEPEKLEVPSVKTQGGFDLSYNRPSPIRSSTPPGLFDDDDEAEEEKEEEEEEEEVEEDDDDEELLKKLEAKYGKLPSKQIEVSDNPEDEEAEEDEEEEEEEDEDEAFPSWRRVKSVPDKKPETADDTPKVPKTGGAKAFEDELLDEDQFFKEHASYDNVPNF